MKENQPQPNPAQGRVRRLVRRVACVVGIHDYHCCATSHYRDNSWSEPGAKSTTATFACLQCMKVKTKHLYGAGWLRTDDLNPPNSAIE